MLQFDVCCEAIHQNFDCGCVLKKGYANLQLSANPSKEIIIQKIWNYWIKDHPWSNRKICILLGLPLFYLKIWLPKVKCCVPFLHKKRLKRYYRQEFLKCTFLPAELERGTKVLQFDVCCKAIDQNFDCGCDRCAILRLDSLLMVDFMQEFGVVKYFTIYIVSHPQRQPHGTRQTQADKFRPYQIDLMFHGLLRSET